MKAILVLNEMPNSCPQCPCIDVEENSYGDVIRAECGNKYKGDISEYLEWENGRPSWCPLKPMPSKKKEEPVGGLFVISIEEAEEIIAFTKMHEREEIPDEMWDIVMRLQEELEK